MKWLLVRCQWGRNEFLHPGIGKIWWNRFIGSVIAVTRYMKRNVVLIAVNLRLNGLWPEHATVAQLQYTGRPLGESTRWELSYSWKAGRANVSGSATRLPGVSGRVALWSRISSSLAIEMVATPASVWWLLWRSFLEILRLSRMDDQMWLSML